MDKNIYEKISKEAKEDNIDRFVVGAIIENDGKILLLKRPSDDFMGGIHELPSGKVESDEDIEKALYREVKEETGLDISDVTDYLDYFDYKSKSGKNTRQFNFKVNIKETGPIKLTEHDSFSWEEPESAKEKVTESVKQVIGKAC